MDGKQARKTGSSSALGMLFDHGCDAINAGVSIISMGSVFGAGWSQVLFFLLFCAYIPFYFQTWEEYYLGAMILPIFNGPTEGIIMAMITCLLSFTFGSEFWQTGVVEIPAEYLIESRILSMMRLPCTEQRFLTPYCCTVVIAGGISFVTMVIQVVKVVLKEIQKGQSAVKPLVDIIPFAVFYPAMFLYCAHSTIAWQKYPLTTMVYIGTAFVEMSVHIMLAHICKGVIKPFERYPGHASLLLLLCVWFQSALDVATIEVEACLLHVLAVYSSLVMTVLLYQICTEISGTLGIYVFKLGKRHAY